MTRRPGFPHRSCDVFARLWGIIIIPPFLQQRCVALRCCSGGRVRNGAVESFGVGAVISLLVVVGDCVIVPGVQMHPLDVS